MRIVTKYLQQVAYQKLQAVQAAIKNGQLVIPMQYSKNYDRITIETFDQNSVSLYVTEPEQYEPILTVRLYKDSGLVCFRVDTLSPSKDQLVNEILLSDTLASISDGMPEGKLILIKSLSGQAMCFFITSLNKPSVSSLGALFSRARQYLSTPETYEAYNQYLDEFSQSEIISNLTD
jgi:hypothetical protein